MPESTDIHKWQDPYDGEEMVGFQWEHRLAMHEPLTDPDLTPIQQQQYAVTVRESLVIHPNRGDTSLPLEMIEGRKYTCRITGNR